MDKKSSFGLALVVAAFIAWQIYFARHQAAYQAAVEVQRAEAERVAAEKAKSNPAAQPAVAPVPGAPLEPNAAPVAPVAPVTPPVEATLETLQTDSAEYVFTNLGGGLSRATL